jgi:hypothetical protein
MAWLAITIECGLISSDLVEQIAATPQDVPGQAPKDFGLDARLSCSFGSIVGSPSVLGAIAILRPETIIRWHRTGFRSWRWRSRKPVGRPRISTELRCGSGPAVAFCGETFIRRSIAPGL